MKGASAKRSKSYEKRFSLNLEMGCDDRLRGAQDFETIWIYPRRRKNVKRGVNENQETGECQGLWSGGGGNVKR